MVLNNFSDNEDVGEWLRDHGDIVVCTQYSSLIYSKSLFTLAIAVNSTRWALLIITVKLYNKQECMFKTAKIVLIVSGIVLMLISLVEAGANCYYQGARVSYVLAIDRAVQVL